MGKGEATCRSVCHCVMAKVEREGRKDEQAAMEAGDRKHRRESKKKEKRRKREREEREGVVHTA